VADDPSREYVLWGATGQARVLRECMAHAGYRLVALFDGAPGLESPFADVKLYVGRDGFAAWRAESGARAFGFLAAIGGHRGADRLQIHDDLTAAGLSPLRARHPTAFVAASAKLGAGSQILAMAAVCVDAVLGRAVIVNTSASVDHECVLGDGVHVGPGARLLGCVTVERLAFVGAQAVVLPRLCIGEGAIIGAGAVVTRDVAPGQTVVGNPARVVRQGPPDTPSRA
jgi:sugar O-acyltransferase (sialic acid O-acetyltransferase NeuD family)